MARPVRYEAAGAVYLVMARGDGGHDVFEGDEDRLAWLDVLERACGRFGWKVHAYVLMGNHYHLLMETPEPNLVAGMKWLMGVFSQGWNRRRKRRGHVFQGRYKAVVVNGDEKSGYYFRIVADYIHLNPVRIGWVGGSSGRRLREYRWSSFIYYRGRKAPEWLTRERVLRDFELAEGRTGLAAYARYLESRAKDREGALTDEALKELRRGWYLGEESFGKELLERLGGKVRARRRMGSVGGDAARAHDEVEAERLVGRGLEALGAPKSRRLLEGRGKWRDEKALVAALVREWTGVRNTWVAERLAMRHEYNVTRAVRRVREEKELAGRFGELKRVSESWD